MPTTVASDEPTAIQQEIESVEAHLASLKVQLRQAKYEAQRLHQQLPPALQSEVSTDCPHETIEAHRNETLGKMPSTESTIHHQAINTTDNYAWPLEAAEYLRYGRQMILPEIGLSGQLRLKDAKILVIGLGGLGCPASAYLAGAGVGTIGLMDGDVVETSNLQRQIAHTTSTCGQYKVDSALEYLLGYVMIEAR